MMKRVLSLVLCLATLLLCFAGCSHGEEDKGAYVRMYLTEPVYDLDPLNAFDNEDTLQVVSLLFAGLFYADEDGKPQKDLVDEYNYIVDKERGTYTLSLTLCTTNWSDGVQVSANDVQFSFRRLFYNDVKHTASAMLFDIKNARAIAAGDDSVDHLGVTVVNNTTVEIEFERDVDLDTFLLALCSPALYPLRDDIVDVNPDWAKKSSTIVCSGPFMVRMMKFNEKDGFVLERNSYYKRNRQKDDLDKYVRPYRLVIDYKTPAAKQMALFGSADAGALYYVGHIPLATRTDGEYAAQLAKADVTAAPSTHVYYLNENAEIGGEKLFANADVRKALSLAIDRDKIVEALVYAEAADGLVPHTLLERTGKKTEFRKKAESYIASTANAEEAKSLLKSAGVTASAFEFSITVAKYDEEHLAVADLVAAAWKALGFKVSVNKVDVIERWETSVTLSGIKTADETAAIRAAVAELPGLISMSANRNATNDTVIATVQAYEDMEGPLVGALRNAGFTVEDAQTVNGTIGIYDNAYRTALQTGDFEVIALDLVATSPDTFSYLAPFAAEFSGNGYTETVGEDGKSVYAVAGHVTGYNSEAYNEKIEAAYAAAKQKDRAAALHEAESILMADMPVIPIVYNQNASLTAKKLSGIKTAFFTAAVWNKAKLSDYWKIALRDGFITEKKDEE